TLAELGSEHQYAVLEMGAGKPGDIAELCRIARPDVSVVTNVGDAHLAQFGRREAIAGTKGAIYAELAPGGTAVINADDPFAPLFRQLAVAHRQLEFGQHPAAVWAGDCQMGPQTRFMLHTPAGEIEVQLAFLGEHNVRNALAAAAVGHAAGATLPQIAAGLARAQPEARRLQLRQTERALLVDDSYNANPASLAAALKAVTPLASRRWLVLGDMLELGPGAEALHAQSGQLARAAGFERIYAIGPLSSVAARAFGEGGRGFATRDGLLTALREDLAEGPAPLLLVKGSRSSSMDQVVDALLGEEDACCSG
ncbi:MAG: Mur ligase family protein, partial [Lysobacterales bacterium]